MLILAVNTVSMTPEQDFKLLIVEDQQETRLLLGKILGKRFPNVFLAEDGLEGLYIFEEEKPHVVISDIRMPRLDGLKLVKEIKKTRPETRVIITTAHSEIDYFLEAIQLKVDHFILKPVVSEEIIDLVHKCINSITNESIIKKQIDEINTLREESLRLEEKYEKAISHAQNSEETFSFLSEFIQEAAAIVKIDNMQNSSPSQLQIVYSNTLFSNLFGTSSESRELQNIQNELYNSVLAFLKQNTKRTTIDSGTFQNEIITYFDCVIHRIDSDCAGILFRMHNKLPENPRAKYEYLEKISHSSSLLWKELSAEVNKPVSAIISLSNLLHQSRLSINQKDTLSEIINLASGIKQEMDGLLLLSQNFSTKSAEEYSTFQVEEVLIDVKDYFSSNNEWKHLSLNIQTQSNFPKSLYSRKESLLIILKELISNACNNTLKGSIQLKLLTQELSEHEQMLSFDVIDSGLGIIQKKLERLKSILEGPIPEDNFSKNTGLEKCKIHAEKLQSKIEASSIPGEGSKFSLILKQPTVIKISSPDSSPIHTSQKLLYISERKTTVKLFHIWASQSNHQAHHAESLSQAMDVIPQVKPHHIFIDLETPDWNGLQNLIKLKNAFPSLAPVTGITAFFRLDEMKSYLAHGMHRYYKAPLTLELITTSLFALDEKYNNPLPVSEHQILSTDSLDCLFLLSKIRNTILQSNENESSLINHLLSDFLEEVSSLKEDISKSIQDNELNTVLNHSVKLKTLLESMGFIGLPQSCSKLIKHCREGSFPNAKTSALELFKKLQQIDSFVEHLLSQ